MHYDFRELFFIGEIKRAKDSEHETDMKTVVLRVWPPVIHHQGVCEKHPSAGLPPTHRTDS